MKFSQSIEINLPREKVIELFKNPDNMKHWQPGLVSFENISGTSGEIGAKSRLKYKMGKRDVEMIETITNRNLPDEFSGTYEAKGIWNEVKNYFIEKPSDKTEWVSESEFRFSGFMKIMGFVMPAAFKKESYKYLKLFKEFAETTSN
jgi:hypothetical protein